MLPFGLEVEMERFTCLINAELNVAFWKLGLSRVKGFTYDKKEGLVKREVDKLYYRSTLKVGQFITVKEQGYCVISGEWLGVISRIDGGFIYAEPAQKANVEGVWLTFNDDIGEEIKKG